MILHNMMSLLPGVDRFIADIVDDCYDHKSVLVVIPPQIDMFEIEYALRQKIESVLDAKEIILTDLTGGDLPAEQIGERFSIKWVSSNCPRTVENLLASSGLPECIFLSDFETLENEQKAMWIKFLNSWNRAPLSGGNRGIQQKPAICLVLSSKDFLSYDFIDVPQLSIRHWFGFPSTLEVRMLCRYNEGYTKKQDEKTRWREYLIPSLTGNDVTLAERLWDNVFNPVDEIVLFFNHDAENRGWSKELLTEWGINNFIRNNDRETGIDKIAKNYSELLVNGVLCRTLEYGTELHTSALAALGNDDQIKNRIWRAQLPLLLPMVDNIRIFMCDHLTAKQGAGWPLYFPPKETEELEQVKTNPRACQLGHLYHTIQNHTQFMDEKRYLHIIHITRRIRNELAHYRPVDYSDYQKMVTESKKFGLYI